MRFITFITGAGACVGGGMYGTLAFQINSPIAATVCTALAVVLLVSGYFFLRESLTTNHHE